MRRRLGESLVDAGTLDAGRLAEALEQQRQQDAPLGRILLNAGAVSTGALVDGLAAASGLGVIDLARSPADPDLMDGLDPGRCLELEAVPWRQVGSTRILAIARPDLADAAIAAFGAGAERVDIALADPELIRRTVAERLGPSLAARAKRRCPEPYSCRAMAARRTRWRGAAVVGVALAFVAAAPLLALKLLMGWILLANLCTMGLRLVAIFARFRAGAAPTTTTPASGTLPLASFQRLPVVSILVPLKGEAAVAERLVAALAALDYPAALLDVKIVLEEADMPTRFALDEVELPAFVEILTVPRDDLQTKPRAMNYALPFCRGSIIGVYDAEDRPDPAQIRAVVAALQAAGPEVACVQGYLDFYNPDDNWLARCFTIEYAMWFRVVLHGVQRLRLPIPLGGTTVFFRRRVLEEIGAWDAHNVTEDADLGMRLARFGYRCEMIRTATLEEANCHARRWIRQRSRWLKGYAITWATHMRRPRRLLADLGWRGFLGFQVLFLGAITSYLSMPLFWLLLAAAAGFGAGMSAVLPAPLAAAFFGTMALGNGVMLTIAVMALRDGGRLRLLPWVPTLFLYWPLGAIAAYRAVAEIFYAPFYWHKTEHGLDRATLEAPSRPRIALRRSSAASRKPC